VFIAGDTTLGSGGHRVSEGRSVSIATAIERVGRSPTTSATAGPA
jgi:hypothetical protein